MKIAKKVFGSIQDKDVNLYTLSNSKGMRADISDFGGIIVSLFVPDRNGNLDDVTLGFDSLEPYTKTGPYFGAIIGRHGNRIEGANFEIDGKQYNLAKNDGNNNLHGGIVGFDKVLWNSKIVSKDNMESLELTYTSIDGEEGFPGNLEVKVEYTVTEDNELVIDYYGVSDKKTVINLTNHAYFNLAGHNSGNVLKHQMMINADSFTVGNEECTPTGEIRDVKGTPMDFRTMKEIGAEIEADDEQIRFGLGYDHNWVLNVKGKTPEKAAEVYEPQSGRVMVMYTTKPGVQFYSANHLDGTLVGKEGVRYNIRDGFCLETQFYPNSLKHKHFPSPIFDAGQEYKYITIYKFSTK